MTVRLPSERELPEPDRIVDRILAETAGTRPRRNGLGVGVAVAAAITITATVLGVTAGSHDQRVVGSAPLVTATPQPPTAAKPPTTRAVGATVTFSDLVVSVRSANQIRVNDVLADEYTILVTTCLRSLPAGARDGRVRLTSDSFSLNTGSATIRVDDPIRAPVPLPTTYPTEGNYKVGQCVSGVIPFGVDRAVTVVSIDYANSFGDSASWIP